MGKQARLKRKQRNLKKLKRVSPGVEQEEEKVPKSFVLRKGDVGYTMRILIGDVRRVMLPNTALNLQEKNQNKLKDFQNVAGPLGVSHFMIFSTTTQGTNYLRISKSPQGPTLTFKVLKYCLTKDVTQSQKNPHSPSFEFKFAPLVVLNNFSAADSHMQIMSTMLQSLFPSINVQKVSLTDCKRVVMLEYDKETGEIEFRHYLITTVPVGASKSVKKIINRKAIPNLSQFDDISDFLTQDTSITESDVEDGAEVRVDVPQSKKKQKAVHQMAVRLKELGPRMQMKLMKIQAGFCDGDILYRHEEDTSGTGGDDSLKVKVKKSEEEKEKEEERTESLRPKMPKFANKKMPKIPKKKAPETAKSKLEKRKMEHQESFEKNNKGGKSGSKQGSNNGPPHKKRKF